MEEMIIDVPNLRSRWALWRDTALYTALFSFWGYLVICFCRFSLWLTGSWATTERAHSVVSTRMHGAIETTASQYVTLLLVALTLILGWSLASSMVFKRRNRRNGTGVADLEQVAHFFDVDPRALVSWKQAKVVIIHHSEDGRIARVDLGEQFGHEERTVEARLAGAVA